MNKRERTKIANAAKRGARWLDKNLPGWSRKVKRRKLDLASTRHCILGQIHGANSEYAYEREVETLGLDDNQIFRLGFDTDEGDYDVLTEAWRDELKMRPR